MAVFIFEDLYHTYIVLPTSTSRLVSWTVWNFLNNKNKSIIFSYIPDMKLPVYNENLNEIVFHKF